jgi:hypothetical protein
VTKCVNVFDDYCWCWSRMADVCCLTRSCVVKGRTQRGMAGVCVIRYSSGSLISNQRSQREVANDFRTSRSGHCRDFIGLLQLYQLMISFSKGLVDEGVCTVLEFAYYAQM